jgi:hypothetical protein
VHKRVNYISPEFVAQHDAHEKTLLRDSSTSLGMTGSRIWKCWLDFAAQDFSFSGRYACPTTNFQRRK